MWDYRLDVVSSFFDEFKCNNNCYYCHGDYFILPKIKRRKYSLDVGIKLCNSILKGDFTVHLTGSGDPLLTSPEHLLKIVDSLKKNKNIDGVSLTTNGILLNNWVDTLEIIGIEDVNVSLPNLKSENYARIMRVDFHSAKDIVTNSIKGIITAKQSGMRVDVNVCVSYFLTENDISNFIDFSRNNEVCIKFFPIINFHDSNDSDAMYKNLIDKLNEFGLSKTSFSRGYGTYKWEIDGSKIDLKIKKQGGKPIQCKECEENKYCQEACWESIRITSWSIQPCSVRSDNIYWLEEENIESLVEKLNSGGKDPFKYMSINGKK